MVITSVEVGDGDNTNSGTLSLIFTANEDITGLTQDEIVISGGGTLSGFTEFSSNVYKATFTPSGVSEKFFLRIGKGNTHSHHSFKYRTA